MERGFQRRVRRSPRLASYDYAQAGVYFVTICTWQREAVLGSVTAAAMVPTSAGSVVEQAWNALPLRFPAVALDAFALMPDHVHGILVLGGQPVVPDDTGRPSLSEVIRAFKSVSGIAGNRALARTGQPFWQRSYHDRIVRNDRELALIRRYIEENPERWDSATNQPAPMPGANGRS